jgi:hypothetical protein
LVVVCCVTYFFSQTAAREAREERRAARKVAKRAKKAKDKADAATEKTVAKKDPSGRWTIAMFTFPRCDLKRSAVLDWLLTRYTHHKAVEKAIVARETHGDGTPHIHILVKHTHQVYIKYNRDCIIGNHRGHASKSPRGWKGGVEYVTKEDKKVLEHNCSVNIELKAKKSKRNTALLEIIERRQIRIEDFEACPSLLLQSQALQQGLQFIRQIENYERSKQYRTEITGLRRWQRDIIRRKLEVEALPDTDASKLRAPFWVVDFDGHSGKSWFTSMLSTHCGAFVVRDTNERDMAYSYQYERCAVFDITRDSVNSVDGKGQSIYSCVEYLLDGQISSSKYNSTQKTFRPVIPFVFTNFEPDKSKLSADRWSQLTILDARTDNEWIPASECQDEILAITSKWMGDPLGSIQPATKRTRDTEQATPTSGIESGDSLEESDRSDSSSDDSDDDDSDKEVFDDSWELEPAPARRKLTQAKKGEAPYAPLKKARPHSQRIDVRSDKQKAADERRSRSRAPSSTTQPVAKPRHVGGDCIDDPIDLTQMQDSDEGEHTEIWSSDDEDAPPLERCDALPKLPSTCVQMGPTQRSSHASVQRSAQQAAAGALKRAREASQQDRDDAERELKSQKTTDERESIEVGYSLGEGWDPLKPKAPPRKKNPLLDEEAGCSEASDEENEEEDTPGSLEDFIASEDED